MKASEIKPNPDNPRIIKDDKFHKLVQSLKDFPEMAAVRPVVINQDNIILGGNMRYKAMVEAGWDDIPVTQVKGWTKEQEREFIIKDNVSGGEWDWDVLANEWDAEKLDAWGLDTPDDWGEDKEVEEDEAPEVDEGETPKSKIGEVYQLGRHRLMCGSATNEDDLNLLLDGVEPDMVFTDPPYGMNYSGRGEKTSSKILNDNIDPTTFYNVGSHIPERYVWGRVENYKHLNEEPRDTIIWKKNNFGMGRGYRGQYECCFYYGSFDGSDSDVWDIAKDQKYEHPTQKPVSLSVRAIKNSKPTIVIDYFAGSGSTLIGCEQSNVQNLSMELDPKYVDVIRKRYHKFVTGSEEGWEDGTPKV